MFYRENGQFKTSYRADQQIFTIRQDKIAIWALDCGGVLGGAHVCHRLFLPRHFDPAGHHVAGSTGGEHSGGLLRPDLAGLRRLHGGGAYGAYNFVVRVPDMPLIPALILGGLCATFFGILFGLPSLRVKGLYLAVATLAAQFFSDWMFLRVKWFTNDSPSGSVSVNNLEVFGMAIQSAQSKYLFCLAVLVVLALLAKNLVRSAIGREWMAIRDMDVAASVIGIRPMYAKLSAFAVSSFIVGVAGALWGFVHLGAWEPAAFSVDISFKLLFMVIIGGLGSIMGSFFGAAFIVVLPIVLNLVLPALASLFGMSISTAGISHAEFIIFGALIVWFLIVEPHGIAKLWSTGKQKMRVWPFPH